MFEYVSFGIIGDEGIAVRSVREVSTFFDPYVEIRHILEVEVSVLVG